MKKTNVLGMLFNLLGVIVFGSMAIWAFKGADPESITWLTVPLLKALKFLFVVIFAPFFAMAVGSFIFTEHKF